VFQKCGTAVLIFAITSVNIHWIY